MTTDVWLPRPEESRLRRLLRGPAEGWSTLGAVAIMIVALAWSIDDAKWVRGVGSLTDFLPSAGFAGIAVGFIGAKLGWGRWTTHLFGAAFAALILPVVAGGIVLGDTVTGYLPAALAARFHASAEVVTQVWIDLAIRGLSLTSQYGHYFIAFGAIVWAAGQHASYAVFGHRRPLDAIVPSGLLLLANMTLTRNDQLHLIVLFSVGVLTLLARSHSAEVGAAWIRRRIGDPDLVGGMYLRSGAVFVGAAILGSLVLTATASSAPLQGVWKNVPATLIRMSQSLQRYLPLGGESRDPGVVVFGAQSPIIGSWIQNDGIAFTAHVLPGETERFRWRVGAYAKFELNAWSWGDTVSIDRSPGEVLLKSLADDPAALAGRREVQVGIVPDTLAQGYLVSPQTVEQVDRPSTVLVTGSQSWFASVDIGGARDYTVTALVPVVGDVPGGITENRLRVASRIYTADVQRLYLDVPAGSLGPASMAILDKVRASAPDNPYDLALALQTYLLDPANFRYDTDVQDEVQAQCSGLSTVECFARIRAGYCQYYASTMTILLREAGVPARFAQGFLPGERSTSGTEVVRNSGAHAWVEVLFPGYGWVDFDPTGGGVGAPVVIPSGAPASPTPVPSLDISTGGPRSSGFGVPGGVGPDDQGDPGGVFGGGRSSGPFIAFALLLAIGGLALASVAWRRGGHPMAPDTAWGSVARWAARFGFAPRPSQTVFEFAGSLGDEVPLMRPELSTVAEAKVEVAYGRRDLGEDRLRGVAMAHRRLRLGLLRLAFRRRGARGPGRGR